MAWPAPTSYLEQQFRAVVVIPLGFTNTAELATSARPLSCEAGTRCATCGILVTRPGGFVRGVEPAAAAAGRVPAAHASDGGGSIRIPGRE